MRTRSIVIAACIALLGANALAHEYEMKGVKVGHPWSRAAAKGGTGAGFATLTNTGREPVVLVSVASPDAASASVHQTVETGGVFSMKAVERLPIAPGQSVTFAPGGYHVMFKGLKAALPQGGKLAATLTFRRGTEVIPMKVTFNVDAPPEQHKH
jgi:periplasmic copper chaperone A